jgi:hypothetical protein
VVDYRFRQIECFSLFERMPHFSRILREVGLLTLGLDVRMSV